jgi:octaprenyl-diphosphate synthase
MIKGAILRELKDPIAPELEEFERRFREDMRSRAPLLDRITHYIVKRKGKRVRPMFVFLSAKLCGEVTDSTYRGASLIELLHTATLVHDDVVDDAFERRGFLSINAIWKNKIAVLVGDYLLAKGLLLSLDHDEFGLLKIVSRAVRQMSEGELLQVEKARRLDIKEDVYYEIIRQKTASLISSSCAVGAASAGASDDMIDHMHNFGEAIGMAFQIKDDLFDYGKEAIGKPRGIDIREKKMTLPLIHVLGNAEGRDRRWIINVMKNHNRDRARVKELIAMVKERGGLDYSTQVMYRYRDKALQLLDQFDHSVEAEGLRKLIEFVIERKY